MKSRQNSRSLPGAGAAPPATADAPVVGAASVSDNVQQESNNQGATSGDQPLTSAPPNALGDTSLMSWLSGQL